MGWKAQLLEHLEDKGVQLEPTSISPQVSVSRAPEQVIPDDQLEAKVHVRHPEIISPVHVMETKPTDRETRLLIAQELAETVGEEFISPAPGEFSSSFYYVFTY